MNYQTVVRALSLVSADLYDIAFQTDEKITLAQAEAAHQHIKPIAEFSNIALQHSWILHRCVTLLLPKECT